MDHSRGRKHIAATLPIPVVSIGIPVNREAVYSVDSDFEGMARNMLDKAYALGHRHILLTGSVEFTPVEYRAHGTLVPYKK